MVEVHRRARKLAPEKSALICVRATVEAATQRADSASPCRSAQVINETTKKLAGRESRMPMSNAKRVPPA